MQAEVASSPITIAVAPNGGRRTRLDHPTLPLSPDDLAHTAAECRDAGAAMVHVHVRKRDGTHLLDGEAYRVATAAIRAAVGDDLVVQITSEALGLYSPAEQRDVVRTVRPEAVSLALRELVPDAGEESAFGEFLAWLKRNGVAPQIILYAPEEAVKLADLHRRGLVPWDSVPVLFVLGRYTVGQTSEPADLLPFLAPHAPSFRHWSLCAFGRRETACVTAGALMGGHPRVGFENNLLRPGGAVASSNADLVADTAAALRACGLTIGRADDLRASMARC